MITQLVIFGVLVAVIFGIGIAIGMLMVPLFERLSEPDEERGGGDDPTND